MSITSFDSWTKSGSQFSQIKKTSKAIIYNFFSKVKIAAVRYESKYFFLTFSGWQFESLKQNIHISEDQQSQEEEVWWRVFHRGCYALCAGPHCWAQRIKLLAGLSTLIFLLHQQKIIPPAPPYPPAHHTITIISVREKELFFNLFHLVFEVMFNPVITVLFFA